MKHLRPDAVNNCEGHLGSVLVGSICGEGSFAEGRINNLDYGFRETAPTVGVLGRDCGEGFLDLLGIAFIWHGFVFGEAVLVRWHAGMSTVRKAVEHRNNPPNCPPTNVLLVLKLKVLHENIAGYP